MHESELRREKVLGEGGMGVVHLVTDRRLGRRAALKVAKPGDPALDARFLREAQVTARLDHPGIPPVHDAGRTGAGELFMLMKFVDGSSLESLLAKDRPSERELIAMLAKAADAVAFAHSKGVVHRDLKPANIMVGAFGEVLVMDWGLARILAESAEIDARLRSERTLVPGGAQLTQAGSVLGTLGYMPPEQASGEDVGVRADVFALGAILVEILTDEPPITGASFANKLTATVKAEIARPRDRKPGVAAELDAIAAKALEADPEDRYASATELAEDLRAYLEGRPVSVHRYGGLERTVRLVRAHPTLFVALGVVLAAAAVTSAVFVAKNRQLGASNAELAKQIDARDAAEEARRKADAARGKAALDKEAASRAQTRLILAEELLARNDANGAAENCLAAGRDWPDPSILNGAARVLWRLRRYRESQESLRASILATPASDPPPYEALLLHSEHEEMIDGVDRAWGLKEIVKRAAARGESESEPAVVAAVSLALLDGDATAAVTAAERGFAKHSGSYRVGLARARALFANGKEVYGDLKKLRNPGSIEDSGGLLLRCDLNASRKNTAGALYWAEIACEHDPDNPKVWLRRAELEAAMDSQKSSGVFAHRHVLRALALHPELAAALALHVRIECSHAKEDSILNDICKRALEAFLERSPDAPEAPRAREKLARLLQGR